MKSNNNKPCKGCINYRMFTFIFQLEEIQRKIEASDAKMSEKLQTIQHVNQVAIEYRSGDSIDAESAPSLGADFMQQASRSPAKPIVCTTPKKTPQKIPVVSKSDETNPKTMNKNDNSASPSTARRNLNMECDNIGAKDGCYDDEDGNHEEIQVEFPARRSSPRKPKYGVQESVVPGAADDPSLTSVKRNV